MKTLVNNAEMEEIAESMICKYSVRNIDTIRCVDIEGFLEQVLHLRIQYENIAEEDKDKVSFLSDGSYPLKVNRDSSVVEVVFPRNTVVIDRYFLRPDLSGQRRFNIAHEGAHIIYNKLSPIASGPFFKRVMCDGCDYSYEELRERMTVCEMQVDRLASILLMPRFLIANIMKEYRGSEAFKLYGDNVIAPQDKLAIQNIADEIGVTFTALRYRLQDLGYLAQHDIDEYLTNELVFD